MSDIMMVFLVFHMPSQVRFDKSGFLSEHFIMTGSFAGYGLAG